MALLEPVSEVVPVSLAVWVADGVAVEVPVWVWLCVTPSGV